MNVPVVSTLPAESIAMPETALWPVPENIRVHAGPAAPAPNQYPGVVDQVMFLGESLECRVRVNGQLLLTRQHPTTRLHQGDAVQVEIPPELVTGARA